jgi:MFS family permease
VLDSALNRLSIAGLAATLVGNGIGRFAYIALMPALILEGWFSAAEASYLGVATLAGYVIGAPLADRLAARWSSATLLRGAMALCSISLVACALPDAGLAWAAGWRTLAGVCGAILMVLPAPLVLPRHAPALRARASGVVFSGIGTGAMVSGLLVPVLVSGVGVALLTGTAQHGLWLRGASGAWLGMGLLCLALTALCWRAWPDDRAAAPSAGVAGERAAALPAEVKRAVLLILAAHGLNAVGYLTHTMFWADYVVRELGRPLSAGGFYWAMFGLGAALGPMVTGILADAFGLRRCLIAGLLLKSAAALLPVLGQGSAALLVSSLLMGLLTPGIVALVSAYALERVGAAHHRRAWGLATTSFALAQAVGGLAMAWAAPRLASYHPLFVVSALALLGAVACIAAIREQPAPQEAANPVHPTAIQP